MCSDIKYDTKIEQVYIENRYICIILKNRAEFRFPASNNKRLAQATDAQLAELELICDSTGLHWGELDEDLSINSILYGKFG